MTKAERRGLELIRMDNDGEDLPVVQRPRAWGATRDEWPRKDTVERLIQAGFVERHTFRREGFTYDVTGLRLTAAGRTEIAKRRGATKVTAR